MSLSTQEKACHCAHTMIIYPAEQENAEESTWTNGIYMLHVKMFAVLWQDS